MIFRPHSATFRYRVASNAHLLYGTYEPDSPALGYDVREYRTLEQAQKRVEELAREGGTSLLQVGILHWMPNEEAKDEMERLQREGVVLE